jgi:Na+-translocating ferredoxin:NAD+ oxidoreductase RnfA subunit
MLPLVALVLLVLALCHWALEPMVGIGTPLLELRALAWLLVLAGLWLFAAPTRR